MSILDKLRLNTWLGMAIVALSITPYAHAEVVIPPAGLEAKVKAYIHDTTPINDPDAKLNVEFVNPLHEAITLKGDNAQFMLEDSRPIPLTFRTIVQVTISTEEETRKIGIPVRLTIEKPVWVATHLIRAKEGVSVKDVTLQTKELDYQAPFTLGKKDNIGGYTSRINITPGSVLDIRNLSQVPVVSRNADVRLIIAMSSGINISVYGKALEDGALGKKIRVQQNTSSNKPRIYNGEVIGKDTVIVKL